MPELLHPGVYVQELPPAVRPIEGVSTSTAAFVGITEKGPVAHPVMVTSFAEYERQFGGFRRDSYLTYAARAFFDNGGRRLYIVRVAPSDAAKAHVTTEGIDVSASSPGLWGNNIKVSVVPSSEPTSGLFKLLVSYIFPTGDQTVETFDNVTNRSAMATDPIPVNYVRAVVNSRSEYITITNEITAAVTVPSPASPASLTTGADGTGTIDYVGDSAAGTGLHALDKTTDVNLIAIPGQGSKATVSAGMEYCKNQRPLQDCFFIGDAGTLTVPEARLDGANPSVHTPSDAHDFAVGSTGGTLDRSAGDYGAVYYPWIWSADPIGIGRNPTILLPPSGFMAGIYARIDNSRGVFKAPAGTEAGVAGALAPAVVVSDSEQDTLNPINVNVIRTVPTSGIVVWGARTVGSDSGWRYIPVRRMAIFLRVSIYNGIQWAVFEPNDEPLWSSLRLNIRSFMLTQFRAGAFQGSKPDDAFFVRCDSTTTTQQDIDNGVVNILVGFAPLKPAEFVVLKLSQKVNQPTQ